MNTNNIGIIKRWLRLVRCFKTALLITTTFRLGMAHPCLRLIFPSVKNTPKSALQTSCVASPNGSGKQQESGWADPPTKGIVPIAKSEQSLQRKTKRLHNVLYKRPETRSGQEYKHKKVLLLSEKLYVGSRFKRNLTNPQLKTVCCVLNW